MESLCVCVCRLDGGEMEGGWVGAGSWMWGRTVPCGGSALGRHRVDSVGGTECPPLIEWIRSTIAIRHLFGSHTVQELQASLVKTTCERQLSAINSSSIE
jgi:hypothetical protein